MAFYIQPTHSIFGEKPRYRCALCGTPFFTGQRSTFERHCLGHSHEEIRSHSPRVQAPGLFDPEYPGSDVEWGRWVRDHSESDPHGWRRWMLTGDDKI